MLSFIFGRGSQNYTKKEINEIQEFWENKHSRMSIIKYDSPFHMLCSYNYFKVALFDSKCMILIIISNTYYVVDFFYSLRNG